MSTMEETAIRALLHEKYVQTNLWDSMNDDERIDAAHAETLIYRKENGEYDDKLSDEETQTFLAEIEGQLKRKMPTKQQVK
jgi:hypothetical protein